MNRGSALIALLVITAIFAAVLLTCLALAPDAPSLLDQVENTGQWIGGAL